MTVGPENLDGRKFGAWWRSIRRRRTPAENTAWRTSPYSARVPGIAVRADLLKLSKYGKGVSRSSLAQYNP
jgi:hypothetical protein